MSKSGIQLAVEAAGGQHALARMCGVTQPTVYGWLERGYAPTSRVIEIEALTGVPRKDLVNPRTRDQIGRAHV